MVLRLILLNYECGQSNKKTRALLSGLIIL